jgi:folylpolyglutamate synthase/dihydropteroate synthase
VERVVVCAPSNERSAPAGDLARFFPDRRAVRVSPTPLAGLEALLSEPGGREILVAGSLYLAGEIRPRLGRLATGSAAP